jgi:hypothetical protein
LSIALIVYYLVNPFLVYGHIHLFYSLRMEREEKGLIYLNFRGIGIGVCKACKAKRYLHVQKI